MTTMTDKLDQRAPTLAEVIARIEAAADLPHSRRRQLLSDLRTFCRWQGAALEHLPADVGFIRRSFGAMTPAGCGVSNRRFANVKSGVGRALDTAGLRQGNRYRGMPLSPAWQVVYDLLPDKYFRDFIRPFMRYASGQGIKPDAVDEATSRAYLAWLERNSFKNPARDHQTFVRLWNRAADTVAGWPQVSLIKPARRKTYGVQWKSLPAPFQADTKAYLDSLRNVELFAPAGPVKPLRESSIKSFKDRLRIAASALLRSGFPESRLISLAVLVEADNFKKIFRFHIDRADGAIKRWHYDLARQLLCVARHWLRLPEQDLEVLGAFCRQLGARCQGDGLTKKNRDRLRPFEDPENFRRLVLLPTIEESQTRRMRPPNRKAALRQQIAIALDLLLLTGMRIGNLAGLQLDRDLHWSRGCGNGVLHISVAAERVKNEVALEYEINADSAGRIKRYIEQYLPLLTNGPCQFLFPGRHGRPKDPGTLGKQVSRLIRARLGLDVNPHLFRHLGGLKLLELHPGAYELVGRHLGHASRETAYRHYSGLEAAQAHQILDDLVTGIRKDGVRPRRSRPKPPNRGKR
jgi:integrase